MKKIVLFCLLLMAAAGMQAQTQVKVLPKMKVGDKYVYDCVVRSDNALLKYTAKSVIKYTVSEKTSSGFIIDMIMTDMKTDSENQKVVTLMNMTQEMLLGVNVRIAVNKNGQAKGIVNFNEVKAKCSAYFNKLAESIFADSNASQTIGMTKEEFMKQAMSTVTEEGMLKGFNSTTTSPMYINGKTITEGKKDTYTNTQGIKIKRTYHVQGKTKFSIDGVIDMTMEEKKEYITKKLIENQPDKAETLRSAVESLAASGDLTMESTEKSSFELLNSGWVKAGNVEIVLTMVGHTFDITSEWALRK